MNAGVKASRSGWSFVSSLALPLSASPNAETEGVEEKVTLARLKAEAAALQEHVAKARAEAWAANGDVAVLDSPCPPPSRRASLARFRSARRPSFPLPPPFMPPLTTPSAAAAEDEASPLKTARQWLSGQMDDGQLAMGHVDTEPEQGDDAREGELILSI